MLKKQNPFNFKSFFQLTLPLQVYVSVWNRISKSDTCLCTDTDPTAIGYQLLPFPLESVYQWFSNFHELWPPSLVSI